MHCVCRVAASHCTGDGLMKKLRDAIVAGATIALLLYAAMTAAKSMADVLQPSMEASAQVDIETAVAVRHERKADYLQLARRDD